ncbi:hypothetical protein PsorP6_009080 [Peronosclerospora sorghi]|uniref:Uncharacterized protein n=1 Tax=Peronosclerospora sorghi TaxID=230839 RepID=A0ACC0W232_9STRA|nr:hypothetical protein PsorP6_009080 [Peronosclerospora sorghi]
MAETLSSLPFQELRGQEFAQLGIGKDFTKSTTSWSFSTSQIPSHPSTETDSQLMDSIWSIDLETAAFVRLMWQMIKKEVSYVLC